MGAQPADLADSYRNLHLTVKHCVGSIPDVWKRTVA